MNNDTQTNVQRFEKLLESLEKAEQEQRRAKDPCNLMPLFRSLNLPCQQLRYNFAQFLHKIAWRIEGLD